MGSQLGKLPPHPLPHSLWKLNRITNPAHYPRADVPFFLASQAHRRNRVPRIRLVSFQVSPSRVLKLRLGHR
jgi:hypothetical protein